MQKRNEIITDVYKRQVPLTSVGHPMEALGTRAAEMILQLIKNPNSDVTYEFPVEISERPSVCTLSLIHIL